MITGGMVANNAPNIGIKFEDRQEVIGKKLLNNQKGLSLLKREIFEKRICFNRKI